MKHINKTNINEVAAIIDKAENICLIGHHNPDGDALGGCLGLSEILTVTGKNCTVVLPSLVPDFLKFLPNSEKIVIGKNGEEFLQNADLIFCIDFNAPSRVKILEKALTEASATKIILDHHPQPDDFAEFILLKPELSSASEVVCDFVELLDYKKFINKNSATHLYTGIMTDTQNFSIETAGAKTFTIASELLQYNIDKIQIYNQVYNTYSRNRFKLMAHLLNDKTFFIDEHKVAYIIFSREDKVKYNYTTGDHEGIVNIPLSIKDTEVSFIFMENLDNIKVSIRSKGNFDVNKFARKYFNGGGHKKAAGGNIDMKLEKIAEFLQEKLEEYAKEQ